MIRRIGYVSNSSSSSFLVYGNRLDYETALKRMKNKKHDVLCILDGFGTSGSAEDFVFKMSPSRMELLEKSKLDITDSYYGAKFIEVKKWLGGDIINVRKPLEGGCFIEFTADNSSALYKKEKANDDAFNKWVDFQKEME